MSAANGRAGARSHVYLPRAAAGKGHHMTLVARPSGGWCRQENERGAHWSRYRRPPHIGKFAGVRGDRRPHASPVRPHGSLPAASPGITRMKRASPFTGRTASAMRISVDDAPPVVAWDPAPYISRAQIRPAQGFPAASTNRDGLRLLMTAAGEDQGAQRRCTPENPRARAGGGPGRRYFRRGKRSEAQLPLPVSRPCPPHNQSPATRICQVCARQG